ncbi:hypothetical protein Ssi03_71110 [Sphaerisporangium siamense]|uniref:DUF4386 domain-containing protein n=1 Tax=Sphaerisporangium siamense TaxID=795645 RepID=A0A7W7G5R8_9ACTN|nr:hypothetical protein [Sphaerisporangium siamense]MBB4698783.1 hypothetical protein [Sphaerisporangium siamense]GII89121.1 hypothetical protein Ssi03_71110 [Sphaerisporangium siamense]
MTSLTHSTTTTTGPRADQANLTGGFLRRAAGGALIAGPLLILGGMMTCPPQASDSAVDYITSLARDSFLTELSAMLLHYGLIACALGALAVPGLVRGRKGRWPTLFGALATALGLLNVSGAVRDDWWRMVTGRQLPIDVAARISDTVDASAFMPLWSGTEILAFLGLLSLSVGLARAGVAGWWPAAVFLGAFASMMFIPVSMTYVVGGAFALMYVPLVVAGLRTFQREHATV